MKNTIIIISCSVAILGLIALGVILMNAQGSIWAIVLTALIVVPAYFLYNAVINQHNAKYNSKSKQKSYKSKSFFTKSKTNDNGKILYFPKDKHK